MPLASDSDFAVLPSSQRWDLGHLRDHLDLLYGDRAPKLSAFWTMLTLSAVIAVALVALWTQRVSDTAQAWVGRVPRARVIGVTAVGRTAAISILCPGDPPSVSDLMKALDGQVPDGIKIVVHASVGKQRTGPLPPCDCPAAVAGALRRDQTGRAKTKMLLS